MRINKILFVGSIICCTLVGTSIQPIINSAIAKETKENVTQSNIQTKQSKTLQVKPNSQIKLITAGSQPRRKLRLTPSVGQKETANMQVDVDMSMSTDGGEKQLLPIPANSTKLNGAINKVEPNGDIHFDFSYSDIDVIAENNIPAATLRRMRNLMKQVEGFKGTTVVSNTGRTKKANLIIPANLDPVLKQMMEQLIDSMEQVSVQVPLEEVGIGASWKILYKIDLYGIDIQKTDTYKLVDIQNNVMTMNISSEAKVASMGQKMVLPQLPKGATMTLQSYKSVGTGIAKVSLNRILPLSTSLSSNTNLRMRMTIADSPGELITDQEVSVKMNIDSE